MAYYNGKKVLSGIMTTRAIEEHYIEASDITETTGAITDFTSQSSYAVYGNFVIIHFQITHSKNETISQGTYYFDFPFPSELISRMSNMAGFVWFDPTGGIVQGQSTAGHFTGAYIYKRSDGVLSARFNSLNVMGEAGNTRWQLTAFIGLN